FPDPQRPGVSLPRVRYWQAWNEPNLTNFLTPQWSRRHGHLVAASPGIYRHLLNAFYAGVKAARRSDVVVTAGTAPFGDHRRGAPLRIREHPPGGGLFPRPNRGPGPAQAVHLPGLPLPVHRISEATGSATVGPRPASRPGADPGSPPRALAHPIPPARTRGPAV